MKYSSIPTAQAVVHHCESRNIKNVVISPGSRNAPLVIGFTQNPFFKCFSVVDERSAAFFALGMAQQLREPVVLVCTSGSAVLNYYPAVAEAFYSDIPMVVLSADRPSYKIDIGDGQTIRQEGVLELHTACSVSLKEDYSHAISARPPKDPVFKLDQSALDKLQEELEVETNKKLNKALNTVALKNSPVHINVHLEEPLYNTTDRMSFRASVQAPEPKKEAGYPWQELRQTWHAASRKMVLVGSCYPKCLQRQWCEQLSNDPGVLVLTETTSNLHHPNFINSIDSLIAPLERDPQSDEKFNELRPDILITFGGMVVSKKVKAFLRKYAPKEHWHVDTTCCGDTFFSLTRHLEIKPDKFFSEVYNQQTNSNSTYRESWLAVKDKYETKRADYLRTIPFSDFLAFHYVFDSVPKGYQLQLANSTTVRYSQLFPYTEDLEVYCNRGTSGIEGSASTAVGASLFYGGPTLYVSGDLSLLYDSNAFWNDEIRADFRIIVVNNNGGGIFRILPNAKDTPYFEEYFETIHHLEVKKLCALYGISYHLAENVDALKEELSTFYEDSAQPKLLEIKTPRLLNDKILHEYFDFIS